MVGRNRNVWDPPRKDEEGRKSVKIWTSRSISGVSVRGLEISPNKLGGSLLEKGHLVQRSSPEDLVSSTTSFRNGPDGLFTKRIIRGD